MRAAADPVQCNSDGLESFAAGDPAAAEHLLRQSFQGIPDERGILVNLGLALMQQSKVDQAERCYRLALSSDEQRVRRSAAKNLGFLLLWRGHHKEGWHWHGRRFEGEPFTASEWRGDPLNGQVLTVWNDVGMGDAFQFVRYTLPLLQRGEKVRFAVAANQMALFRDHLAWELTEVVDRRSVDHLDGGPQIPLMSLIPLLDEDTLGVVDSQSQLGIHHKSTKQQSSMWGCAGQAIPKTAPCMPTKAAHLISCSKCSKGCCPRARQSAFKLMRLRPINASSCSQLRLTGGIP